MSYVHRTRCRICGSANLLQFLDLGTMPLANSFLPKARLQEHEPQFPLRVCCCQNCGLIQLLDVVDKDHLFREYAYFSSSTRTVPAHLTGLAREVVSRMTRSNDPLVVELGSNDGVLLRAFQEFGVRTLGVEPARNIASVARKSGVETISEFFDESVAQDILATKGKAQVVVANNVMAHVDNLHALLRAIKILLLDEGYFVFEVPYLKNLIANIEYDTIYHEHLSYFSLAPLKNLFDQHDMEVLDVEPLTIHGGSVRVFVRPHKDAGSVSDRVKDMLDSETKTELTNEKRLAEFAAKVTDERAQLVKLISLKKKSGKTMVGYGAPAKGNTLLNYCKIGTQYLDYVCDTTPSKQGKFTPGMHIPVVPPSAFQNNPPDCALMLAWNYKEEILMKEKAFLANGGEFIIPIPVPEVIRGPR